MANFQSQRTRIIWGNKSDFFALSDRENFHFKFTWVHSLGICEYLRIKFIFKFLLAFETRTPLESSISRVTHSPEYFNEMKILEDLWEMGRDFLSDANIFFLFLSFFSWKMIMFGYNLLEIQIIIQSLHFIFMILKV